MRILHVTRELAEDRRYGLGRSLQPVVQALGKRGHALRYLCQADLADTQRQRRTKWVNRAQRWLRANDATDLNALVAAWAERLQMGWMAADIAARDAFDVVHLHDPWLAVGYEWGALRWGGGQRRWGVTEHGYGSYAHATEFDGLRQGRWAQQALHRLEAGVLHRAHWVVTPTTLAQQALLHDLGLRAAPPGRRVLHHPRPNWSMTGCDTARAQLGWPAQALVVVSVGRVAPVKQMDWVLRACARWRPALPALRLHICGQGQDQSLIEQAHTLGMGDALQIEAYDDIRLPLQAADVYVSASASESFGLANLEALAAGLPCVCTAVGGVPEVVGDAAWLVKDESGLVDALGRLLTNANARRHWAQRSRAWVMRWPTVDDVADGYESIYRES